MQSPLDDAPPLISAVSNLETTRLDLRDEGYRLRHPRLEEWLLSSIAHGGIREPLRGVLNASGGGGVLLDGFMRLRCAGKLDLGIVPVPATGADEIKDILQLLRGSHEP